MMETLETDHEFSLGENVLCYYQDTLYEGKCLKRRKIDGEIEYYIHYKNFSNRFDEWVNSDQLLEINEINLDHMERYNKILSNGSKRKNSKISTVATNKKQRVEKSMRKRGRPKKVVKNDNDPEDDEVLAAKHGITKCYVVLQNIELIPEPAVQGAILQNIELIRESAVQGAAIETDKHDIAVQTIEQECSKHNSAVQAVEQESTKHNVAVQTAKDESAVKADNCDAAVQTIEQESTKHNASVQTAKDESAVKADDCDAAVQTIEQESTKNNASVQTDDQESVKHSLAVQTTKDESAVKVDNCDATVQTIELESTKHDAAVQTDEEEAAKQNLAVQAVEQPLKHTVTVQTTNYAPSVQANASQSLLMKLLSKKIGDNWNGVKMPPRLNEAIEIDWYMNNKFQKVLRFPEVHYVAEVIYSFNKTHNLKDFMTKLRYTSMGLFLIQHFNLIIHSRLMYANEKICYLQNQGMEHFKRKNYGNSMKYYYKNSLYPKKVWCYVYNIRYLLRFIVQLPKYMVPMWFAQFEIDDIINYINEFLMFLENNFDTYLPDDDYII